MSCRPTKAATELEFVSQVVRQPAAGDPCCGPLIRQGFTAATLEVYESAFFSTEAHDLLWRGSQDYPDDAMYFDLCALHWMSLACLVALRGHLFEESAWRTAGQELLAQVCRTQGWDPKEIANAFTWQQVRLT